MAGSALQRTQRSKHDPPLDVSPIIKQNLRDLDSLLDQTPIPGPKPWTDELERAALFHAANATPPVVALTSVGMAPRAAQDYLSDDPPETYKRACVTLRERLKNASSWCERALLARIADAGTEHRFWQANAWILERSKAFSQQYIAVQDSTAFGPATVVNIGQLVIQAAPGQSLPNRQLVVDAEVISEGESEEIQANPTDVTLSSPLLAASNTK